MLRCVKSREAGIAPEQQQHVENSRGNRPAGQGGTQRLRQLAKPQFGGFGFGAGGGGWFGGTFGGVAGGGYQNTAIGQTIVLAYLDAYKKLVSQLGGLPADASRAAPRAQ